MMNFMFCHDKFKKVIDTYCDSHGTSINDLAKKYGVAQSTLNEILQKRTKNPTFNVLIKLAKGMDVKMEDFCKTERI